MPGADHSRTRPAAGCPVCGRPAGPETQCAECGWTLRSPLRPGAVTAQLREEFAARLRQAQQVFDVRVAARIGAHSEPYHKYLRGGPPDAAQWATAQESASLDAGDAITEGPLHVALADLAGALTANAQASIVEVSADGIAVSRTGLDGSGTPWLDRAPVLAWTSLLPMLSGTEAERHFQLAGGTGLLDRPAISDRLRAGLADVPGGDFLVICRVAGWVIPEWAAGLLAGRPGARLLRVAGRADDLPVGALLAGLTIEAPLRQDYQLMVAVVDDASGKVTLEARQIFAYGDGPGTESRLLLRRPPGGGADTTLAIFGAASAADSEPLALLSVPPPAEPEFSLRTVLDGPGRLRVIEPPGAAVRPGTWAQVRSEIPDRVEVTAGPADLVCAVELAGPTPQVRARLRLVRMLLELLADECGEPGHLRVSMVTCTDHVFIRGHENRSVVSGTVLCPAPIALAWIAKQSTAPMVNDSAAPIEDLLYEAAIMLADSRAAGRAARLLIVGGRRPHPFPPGVDRIPPCPHRYKWRQSLKQLTGQAGTRCVAVADAARNDPMHAATWEELGPGGLRWLPEATARQIGEDLGLLARHAQRIPIPLLNTE